MKFYIIIFILYLGVGIVSCFVNTAEVDQFGVILWKTPLYTFTPFVFCNFLLFKYLNLNNKKDLVSNVLFFSFSYAVATSFWVYYLNMNLGGAKDIVIAGEVIARKPGRGQGKPAIVIRSKEKNIPLSIVNKEWNTIDKGEYYTIVLYEGIFGFYYKERI